MDIWTDDEEMEKKQSYEEIKQCFDMYFTVKHCSKCLHFHDCEQIAREESDSDRDIPDGPPCLVQELFGPDDCYSCNEKDDCDRKNGGD